MTTMHQATTMILAIVLMTAVGCDQNEQKIQDLQQEKADVAKQLETSKAEAASLVTEITEINAKAADAENALAGMRTKYDQLLSQSEAMKAKLQQAADAAALKAQLEQAEKRAADAEKALADLRTEYDNSIAQARDLAAKSASELAALRQQVAELTKALEQLKPSIPGEPSPAQP